MKFTALLALWLLAAAMGCGDGSESNDDGGVGPDDPRVFLPIWALLDGDTPVTGARVQVYFGEGPTLERLHPLGSDLKLTSDAGISMLEFGSLPQTFIVVVRGGRAEGRALRGSLSARVRDYSNGAVVDVTPVTSLIERWERDEPSVDRTAAVYGALGIPDWADANDLGATDHWFDGDAFLDYTDGNLAQALPQLLTEIKSGETMRFEGQAGEPPGGLAEWWKKLDVTEIVAGGFLDLGFSLVFNGIEAGGRWLIGKLLEEWGLRDALKTDTDIIKEMLFSLNKRTTELQMTVESVKNAVAESQFSTLVAAINPQIAVIDGISRELTTLANMKKDDPTRVGYSRMLVQHIKDQLADDFAADKLHLALDNATPAANDILKAASQVYGTQRWFTAKSSANIKAVYDYFAIYQFRLAVLLTNYWSTEPNIFSVATRKQSIDAILANVVAQQKDRLKPAVPDDKFVDTRTMTVWDRKPAWINGQGYKPNQGRCHCAPYTDPYCDREDPTAAQRASGLGTEDDFKRLIDGWDLNNSCGARPCSNPLEWLRKEVGLVTSAPGNTPSSQVGHMWLGPVPVAPVRFGIGQCGYNRITRSNLSESERPGPHVFINNLTSQDPQFYFAHAMNRQVIASGTYWWPLGGR